MAVLTRSQRDALAYLYLTGETPTATLKGHVVGFTSEDLDVLKDGGLVSTRRTLPGVNGVSYVRLTPEGRAVLEGGSVPVSLTARQKLLIYAVLCYAQANVDDVNETFQELGEDDEPTGGLTLAGVKAEAFTSEEFMSVLPLFE